MTFSGVANSNWDNGVSGTTNLYWYNGNTYQSLTTALNYDDTYKFRIERTSGGVLTFKGETAGGVISTLATVTAYSGTGTNRIEFSQQGNTNTGTFSEIRNIRGVKDLTTFAGDDATNATGTALGTTNVPTSPVTEVSGVMLMKNAYGTNSLGTDVKAYFTADNSNWTEAVSYDDAGTFSDTTKMITLGKTTVTSGSDVRWKIVFANQVAASKVAYIYGIGTNY